MKLSEHNGEVTIHQEHDDGLNWRITKNSKENTKSPTPGEIISGPIEIIIKVQSEEEEEEEEEVEEKPKKKKKKKTKGKKDEKIRMLTMSFGEALRLINKEKVNVNFYETRLFCKQLYIIVYSNVSKASCMIIYFQNI